MNTQLAFAFGMLAMVAITMLVTIVVGMVKVIKLGKQIENTERELSRFIDRVESSPALDNLSRELYLEIHDVKKQLDSRVDETQSVCDRRVDDEIKSLQDEINNIYRMVDSRFDKFENRIKTKVEPDISGIDLVIEKTKKQQLNG